MSKIKGMSLPNLPWQDKPEGCGEPVWRYSQNPIIGRHDIPSSNSIFNSAVTPFGDSFAGVFQCDSRSVSMDLFPGFSKDGIHWEISHEPIRFVGENEKILKREYRYDPRVCRIEDRYYITWCNCYHGPTVGIAYTFDFKVFHQLENAFLPYNRNGVLFPRKINGYYAMVSRPSDTGHTPFGDIFYSASPDLEFWGRHRYVMGAVPGDASAWQSKKIGPGPVPIETEAGWLLLYHGAIQTCNGFVYRMGAALLDLERPWLLKERSAYYLLGPEEPYECIGDVPNVVFPCAALADGDTGRICIYYGCADTVTGLAFTTVHEVLSFMREHPMQRQPAGLAPQPKQPYSSGIEPPGRNDKMYKAGVIGLGQIAYYIDQDPDRKIIWSHIKAYQAVGQTEIIAVCSRQEEKVNRIKAECGIPKGYTDYNTMLEENNFDIISICTPIETHFAIIKKCIETGVRAVFCEKTLSYSLEEGEQMVELCRESHTVLGVNYILRWDRLNREIKELLDQNAIGNIYTLVGYGATALHTSASHLIDLMVYFADSRPEWVVGEKQKDFVRLVNGIEDCGGTGTVKFESGAMGFIKGVSASPHKYMMELDILGENGRIRLHENGLSYDFYQYSGRCSQTGAGYEDLKLVKTRRKDNGNERMVDALSDILHCMEYGGEPLSNGATALASIQIIEGIKLSDGRKSMVHFGIA